MLLLKLHIILLKMSKKEGKMLKKILVLIIGCSLFAFTNNSPVEGRKTNGTPSIEKQYSQIGFVSVNEAIKSFENHYKRKLELPHNIQENLPFKITHKFGRFHGDDRGALELEYLNEYNKGLFSIDIAPEDKDLPKRSIEKKLVLKDGTRASYSLKPYDFYYFRFHKNGWVYRFVLKEKGPGYKASLINLIKIAESV